LPCAFVQPELFLDFPAPRGGKDDLSGVPGSFHWPARRACTRILASPLAALPRAISMLDNAVTHRHGQNPGTASPTRVWPLPTSVFPYDLPGCALLSCHVEPVVPLFQRIKRRGWLPGTHQSQLAEKSPAQTREPQCSPARMAIPSC